MGWEIRTFSAWPLSVQEIEYSLTKAARDCRCATRGSQNRRIRPVCETITSRKMEGVLCGPAGRIRGGRRIERGGASRYDERDSLLPPPVLLASERAPCAGLLSGSPRYCSPCRRSAKSPSPQGCR